MVRGAGVSLCKLCCTNRYNSQEICFFAPRKVISGHFVQFLFITMKYEDFLVDLICLLFAIVISKESLKKFHGVRVQLLRFWGEERVSKESSVVYVVGGATAVFPREGRAAYAKRRQEGRRPGVRLHQRVPWRRRESEALICCLPHLQTS